MHIMNDMSNASYAILGGMMTSFAELGLNDQILAGVEALGFSEPTPVQAEAIPYVLAGRDVVASAQTGTGKTAAFVLPTLQRLQEHIASSANSEADSCAGAQDADTATISTPPDTNSDASTMHRRRRRRRRGGKRRNEDRSIPALSTPARPLALIVTPTRELAQQIKRVVNTACTHTGQRAVIIMGGARMDTQVRNLARGCDLLVATPGRLIDLMEHGVIDLSGASILVLDEADRMLDMGFWPSVRKIVAALPQQRQSLLFSATIPPSVKTMIETMLFDPAYIEIAQVGETATTVEQHLCPVAQGQKTQLLRSLVHSTNPDRMLVFCRTKQRVDEVTHALKAAGLKAEVMHSDRRQEARDRALRRFRNGKVQLLIATDVMSRGIDVSDIDAVVNYDVPLDPEDYVHRIGRTGRAGAVGHAYTFVAPDELTPLREIEYFTHTRIPIWDLPGFSYDEGRIIPSERRSAERVVRSVFSGSRSRGLGSFGGRYGRHY